MKEKEKSLINMCRTCLRHISSRERILTIYEISDLIMSYTSVKITENDGLPSNICSGCHKKANQAYNFKILCEQSEEKLRNNIHLFNKSCTGNPPGEDIDSLRIGEDNTTNKIMEVITDNSRLLGSQEKVEKECYHKKANQPLVCNILCEESEEKLCDNIHLFSKSCIDNPPREDVDSLRIHEDNTTNKTVEIITDNSILLGSQENVEKDSSGNCSSKLFDDHEDKDEINKVHKQKVKRKDKQYKCRFCDTYFSQCTWLFKHEKKHEDGIKCYNCGRAFSTFKQLRSHMNGHNRKGAHLCPTCGKQFTLPENLARHERIHTGVRPYQCKVCNRSFTQSNELKSHMVTHSSEKVHICNVCGNKYARHVSLKIHIRRLHSDASVLRPYCCKICNRSFKDKRDLSQHIVTHTGEQRHICKVCSHTFSRASNLRVHERIHFGPKPFVCHICQRSFTQKHVLNSHLRTHPAM